MGGALVGWKFYNRGDNSAQVLRDVDAALVEGCRVYAHNHEYMKHVLEQVHEGAFEHHYTMGGRRTGARFDEEASLDEVLPAMIAKLNADPPAAHLAKELEQCLDKGGDAPVNPGRGDAPASTTNGK